MERRTARGLVSAVAAPNNAIIDAIFKLSIMVELTRSQVTGPPKVIPAIHDGSGIWGSVKRVCPGIGTPITIPINTLKAITKRISFSAQR